MLSPSVVCDRCTLKLRTICFLMVNSNIEKAMWLFEDFLGFWGWGETASGVSYRKQSGEKTVVGFAIVCKLNGFQFCMLFCTTSWLLLCVIQCTMYCCYCKKRIIISHFTLSDAGFTSEWLFLRNKALMYYMAANWKHWFKN